MLSYYIVLSEKRKAQKLVLAFVPPALHNMGISTGKEGSHAAHHRRAFRHHRPKIHQKHAPARAVPGWRNSDHRTEPAPLVANRPLCARKARLDRSRQQQLAERPAATNPAFADGQTVYLWGGSYTLRLEEASRGRSALQRGQEIVLSVHPEDDTSQRESLLNDFYREALSNQIAARLPLWEARTGLHPSAWQIKNMKTRWGTCNTATRKIWAEPPARQAAARLPRLRHRARADASALSRPWAGFQNIFDVRHAKLAGGPKSTQQSDLI